MIGKDKTTAEKLAGDEPKWERYADGVERLALDGDDFLYRANGQIVYAADPSIGNTLYHIMSAIWDMAHGDSK